MTAGYEFVPRFRYIIAITNAQHPVVTFSEDHDFIDYEIVSFRVTPAFGMFEINNLQSKVLSHTNNTITVDIDSQFWTAFVYPATVPKYTPPVCVPVGSGVNENLYVSTVILQDCFDNVRT